GLCKSCARGICVDCAVDIGHGLACRDRCEDRSRAILQITEYNLQQMAKLSSPKVHLVSPPPPQLQSPTYSASHVTAQLITHIRQTHRFQRTSGRFYAAIGAILLVIGIFQAMMFPVVLGLCFLVFGT